MKTILLLDHDSMHGSVMAMRLRFWNYMVIVHDLRTPVRIRPSEIRMVLAVDPRPDDERIAIHKAISNLRQIPSLFYSELSVYRPKECVADLFVGCNEPMGYLRQQVDLGTFRRTGPHKTDWHVEREIA